MLSYKNNQSEILGGTRLCFDYGQMGIEIISSVCFFEQVLAMNVLSNFLFNTEDFQGLKLCSTIHFVDMMNDCLKCRLFDYIFSLINVGE